MNWIANNHQACGIAPGDPAAKNAMPVLGLQTNGWNPYEVWMTRISLPRDRDNARTRVDAALVAGSALTGVAEQLVDIGEVDEQVWQVSS